MAIFIFYKIAGAYFMDNLDADYDVELETARENRDIIRFKMIVRSGLCTEFALNNCLVRTAAMEKCGDFSDVLKDAGVDLRHYFNGRLDRKAYVGDIEGIKKYRAYGADIHHNNEQPLRAAVLGRQFDAAVYLVTLGAISGNAFPNNVCKNLERDYPFMAEEAREFLRSLEGINRQVRAMMDMALGS